MSSFSFDQYKGKGLTGLSNLGNTCFINSCLQALFHVYEFNQILDDESFTKRLSIHRDKKYAHDCFLLMEYDKLRKLYFSQNCSISPGAFIKSVQLVAKEKKQELFTGYNQNDLPEFFMFLIDTFHYAFHRQVNMEIVGKTKNEEDDLAKNCFLMMKNMYSKEYSEIIKLFYGVHVSQIINLHSKKVLKNTPEPFFILDLPIPENNKNPSLIDCFDAYVESEILKNENAWYNEDTKQKEDIEKKLVFWTLPDVMVIALKRFHYTGKKIQKPVQIPMNHLDLNKYVKNYIKTKYNYECFAICNHSGGTLGGHYTASIRNADGNWYLYNDMQIIKIEETLEQINNNVSYCLFYRKKVAD